MADLIGYRISGDTTKALRSVVSEVQRANVAAVRAAGQALAAEARRRAPTYSGDRRDVPKGRLRKGIKAGRVMKVGTTSASVKVGPRGPVVHKYAAKIEEIKPYMSPAYAEAAAGLATVAATAYAAAIERGAR